MRHTADATAKYGKPAKVCRLAHIPPIEPQEMFSLNIDKYKGGIALWGAVPPVYDTTTLPIDRGIHLHARTHAGATKEMDRTFRAIRILGDRLPKEGIFVSELDAIYYMVSSVFGFEMRQVICSYCGHPHLDRDWFSVHPHRRHLCAGCGRHFSDDRTGIGNPISGVREACGIKKQVTKPAGKKLNLRQAEYPGGIQIWGSNPALVWTSTAAEEEGIHVHAFDKGGKHPVKDDTFSKVIIDGIELDPQMVRVLMAQMSLPSRKGRLAAVTCPSCNASPFESGVLAFTPTAAHTCDRCGRKLTARGRFRKTISNPLIGILARLAQHAVREPQQHDLDLMPKTL
jgi:transposase-like protein